MKRWLVRICVFLILGAIVNVAVAWGIAFAENGKEGHVVGRMEWKANGLKHHAMMLEGSGFQSILAAIGHLFPDDSSVPEPPEFLPRWYRPVHDTLVPEAQLPFLLAHHACGWPISALRCSFTGGRSWRDPTSTLHQGIEIRSLQTSRGITYRRALPLMPIWPGFAINTAFYAFVLWLLFAGPFVVRRWRRIRRGLCPKCAYDLRGSVGTTACPECGSIVPS